MYLSCRQYKNVVVLLKCNYFYLTIIIQNKQMGGCAGKQPAKSNKLPNDTSKPQQPKIQPFKPVQPVQPLQPVQSIQPLQAQPIQPADPKPMQAGKPPILEINNSNLHSSIEATKLIDGNKSPSNNISKTQYLSDDKVNIDPKNDSAIKESVIKESAIKESGVKQVPVLQQSVHRSNIETKPLVDEKQGSQIHREELPNAESKPNSQMKPVSQIKPISQVKPTSQFKNISQIKQAIQFKKMSEVKQTSQIKSVANVNSGIKEIQQFSQLNRDKNQSNNKSRLTFQQDNEAVPEQNVEKFYSQVEINFAVEVK